MDQPLEVRAFDTSAGGRIFQIPVEAFPSLWTYIYLVSFGDYLVLIDTGSGFGNSNENLEAGFRAINDGLNRGGVTFADLTHILITHGHIDHFGGLNFLRPRTQARLGIHELDRRNLTNYEERLAVVSRALERFLREAGIPAERIPDYLGLYTLTKGLFHSLDVDFTYEADHMRLGPFEFLHVPGHCAGHVVIRLHDVLFSGDQVLDDITPHQAPETLTLSTGLEHYLRSLDALEAWGKGVRLTLGGHKRPIHDLPGRIQAIRQAHAERLQQVLDFFESANTIRAVSQHLFGEVRGYNVLLAIEEAGAHVEYLYQRGRLRIENLAEYEQTNGPLPILYRTN